MKNHCPSARRALAFYRLRHKGWLELRGVKSRFKLSQPRGCGHTRWLVDVTRERSSQARERYYRWREEMARRTLRDFKVTSGNNAWFRAIEQVQKVYPGTRTWLRSCSAPRSEGGWGRWVPNTQGSGAGGWLQFMESTFWRMFGAAYSEATAMGFTVPKSAMSWYSPLGQALAGGWAVRHDATGEWSGSGC